MAQPRKVGPGPVGTSCLTCKRRHKKCDLRRPVCERCETGGFECLGFSHNNWSSRVPLGSSRPRPILPKQDINNIPSVRQAHSSCLQSGAGPDSLDLSAQMSPLPRGNETATSSASSSPCSGDLMLNAVQHTDPAHTRSNSEMPTTRNDQSVLAARSQSLAKPTPGPTPSLRSLFKFYTQIPYVPYHLSKTLLESVNLEDYVMSHCDRMIEHAYFKPVQAESALIRNKFTSRMRASAFTRWIMFLNARICESYYTGGTSRNTTHDLWLCQMEQALRDALAGDLTPSETQDRRGNWLEVTILKAMASQCSNTYWVPRNATLAFLQLLFSEPTLWPSGGDLTSVPLANVISSRRHELSYFALMDIKAAMVFGLPQQVEYDTSLACPPNSLTLYERIHYTPIEFQIILAEINACRDKSPNARDWEDIERRLVTWRACPSEHDARLESWMKVAWFAVQESWRHTLLAYLYMAVCGAPSDDPRIQSSVRQILSVISTVKKQESVDVPFFIQPLMAGICARSEKHRSLARKQLTNASEIAPHLMRATDFARVLDHLWHGAAAGGRAIRWGDYVCAREIVLPVLM